MLDMSKIEVGQIELRLHMVSVEDVVSQVASTVEPLVATKQLHFGFETGGAGQILADEGKLKQMILNPVSNAIKITPVGGPGAIKATRGHSRLTETATAHASRC